MLFLYGISCFWSYEQHKNLFICRLLSAWVEVCFGSCTGAAVMTSSLARMQLFFTKSLLPGLDFSLKMVSEAGAGG